MSVQPHITAAIGVPRAIALRFPAGNQVGEAGKPQQQRIILTAALEAIRAIDKPGTIVELPYRWRRFPIHEEPVLRGISQGPRHPQAEAIGEALDAVVRAVHTYKTSMQGTRLQGEWRSVARVSGEPGEIGLTALEEAGDGINQDAKGRLAQLAAGLTQR